MGAISGTSCVCVCVCVCEGGEEREGGGVAACHWRTLTLRRRGLLVYIYICIIQGHRREVTYCSGFLEFWVGVGGCVWGGMSWRG